MLSRSPERLFRRFAETGDAAALARVFDQVAPKLVRVARHLARDQAAVEDLVQSTFQVAMERARTWERSRPLEPWLLGILANQAGLARRREGRPLEPERLHVPSTDDPNLAAERGELRRAVGAALTELPDVYRDVLSAHLLDGKRPAEIAHDLGRSVGSVRVQLHRGLKRMRGALPAGFASGALLALRRVFEREGERAPLRVPDESLVLGAVRARLFASVPEGAAASSAFLGGIAVTKKVLAFVAAGTAVGIGLVWNAAAPSVPSEPRIAAAHSSEEPEALAPAGSAVEASPTEAASAQVSSRAPAAGASPKASDAGPRVIPAIRGKVRDAASGEPIAGATLDWIELAPRSEPAVTLADGSFFLSAEGARPIGLQVAAEGFAPHYDYQWTAEALAAASTSDGPVDIGVVELERGALVAGRVLGADGKPAEDVPVFIFRHYRGLTAERTFAFEAARTDADGGFRLRDRVPYGGEWAYEHVLVAADAEGLGTARLALLEGAGDREDLLIELAGGHELVVSVRDGAEPIAGVRVVLAPRFVPLEQLGSLDAGEHWNGRIEGFRALLERRTDADGRAVFENLPVGGDANDPSPARYAVSVHATPAPTAREVDLDPLRPTHVRIDLAASGFHSIAGRVLGEDGRAVAGARVLVGDEPVEVDRQGTFAIEGVAANGGRVFVRAQAPGYAPDARAIDCAEGDTHAPLELRLAPAASIAGRVVDGDGAPVPGATVHLERHWADVQAGATPENRSGAPDAAGRFAFDDLRPGSWQLSVFPPFGDDGFAGLASRVVSAGSGELEIVLTRLAQGVARLVVRVYEAATGEAVDVDQALILPRGEHPGTSYALAPRPHRQHGRVVATELRPGAWRLWVEAQELGPAFADFDVGEDDRELELDLALSKTHGVLRGSVELGELVTEHVRIDVALVDAEAVPRGAGWESVGTTRGTSALAPDGSFRFEGLQPGRYRVRLGHFSHLAMRDVDVEGDRDEPLVLRPELGVRIDFVGVVPSEGTEGEYVVVRVAGEGGWDSGTVYGPIRDGSFQASVLVPPGRHDYRVVFSRAGAAGTSGDGEFAASGSFTAVLGEPHGIGVALTPSAER